MFKRIMLIVGISLLLSVGYSNLSAQETKIIAWPNCEMGDAIFRYLKIPFVSWAGHVGIYFCSKSKPIVGTDFTIDEKGLITKIDIKESDTRHSMIQGNGYKSENPQWPPEIKEVGLVTLDFALDNMPPWGAYNNGKLTAYQRRKIVAHAYQQVYLGCRYATGDPKKGEKPRDIKNPATQEKNGSFRCDGFIEYCYEQIGSGFFSAQDELDCWWRREWSGIHIPKFYPESLAKKMKMTEAKAPQIVSTELWKGDKKIEEDEKTTGMVTVKVKVKDGTNGSGIDRVKFYWDDWFESPNNIEHPIDEDDEDKNDDGVEQNYSCNWDTTTVETGKGYWVYTKVYDRAGNIATGEIFRITTSYTVDDGFHIIIDHTPPQVVNISPSNNATKISLGKRIRITFSEEMDKKTINKDTILVNNGAIVGSITYNEDLRTAIFVPEKPLDINTNYAVLVKGGDTGVKDKAGNPMSSDYSFSFKTTDGLVPGRVIEVAVTYTDEYGKKHPVPAGTQFMSSYFLKASGVETYIVYPGTWRWVEEDGKVRFNWPGGNLDEQKFRVFFESKSYSLRKNTPSFWVLMTKETNTQVHTFASQLFDIYKPTNSDVYVPVAGTITINYDEVVNIPHWNKVYYNRTGALHSLGAFNKGFDYIVTHDLGINPVDYASWMENRDFTLEGITCYGTNSPHVDKLSAWRILVNGIKKDEWSEDKLLASFGNLLIKRFGENYMDFKLLLRPKFNRRTDVFQAWLNGFSHYYSCITRGTSTIEVRDVDTQITNTYNLESLGSETQGLDNEAAVAGALWKMKDPYYVWKATRKYDNIITPPHKGFNLQDFWRELGTQSYIPMPEQTWLEHGLMPKIKFATATNTPNPQLFWDRNGILDNSIGISWTLEVATESTFTNPVLFVKTQIRQENYHLTDINLEDGIYYWRVRVEDEYLPGNLQNALPRLYSPNSSFEIRLPKKAGITVISDPNTQGIPSDVIVSIYDKEGSVYTGAYWVEHDQMNRTRTLDLRYTPITVHFEAQGGNAIVPPDYIFEEGSCVHIFENGIIFNEPGTYSVTISLSGEGIDIPAVSHTGIKVVPKGIIPDHFHVVDILDPIEEGGTSNVSLVVHDANCNLVIGYSGSVYWTSTDIQSTLPQTYTFTASDYGVKTFVDGVVLNTPGSQTVFAIDVNNPQIMGSQTVYVGSPTIINNPPILEWTGEINFQRDGLHPKTGDVNTLFEYRVKYKDIDGNLPATGYPKVHIYKVGIPVPGSPFSLGYVSGTPTTGAIYSFSTTFSLGTYTYQFEAKDIHGAQASGTPTLITQGPIVTKPEIWIHPTSGTVDTIVTVTGEGFGQSEAVVIDFGITKSITMTLTNENGTFATIFTVNVQAGCGTLTVSAYGLASNLFAKTQFLMQARITSVIPGIGTVGSIVSVRGDGFHANEEIAIDFGINPTITITVSDELGQFSTVFTVDTQAGGGTLTVSAKGIISGCEAYSKFVIVGNIILLSPSSGTVGASVTIAGNGFGAIEQIQIDLGMTLTICLTTTDAKGSWTATFKVSSQPYGLTTITAVGLLSNAKAYAIFNIKPDFVIIRGKVVDSMSNQPIGKAVIELIQNKRVKGTATTDNKGNYRIENIQGGIYQIRAKKEIVYRWRWWSWWRQEWREIVWKRLIYIPHTKYQVEVNTVDNEVNFYLSRAWWVEWAHIEEGNEINIKENKNMDVRIRVNYDPKYWFYLYPKDASSYEIKDFSRKSIGLNGCWSNSGRWYNIDWDDGTYIDKANNRLHIKVWIGGYWWRRAYFNYRYTIDCQLKGASNMDKNNPIVAFEPEKEKTPKIGMVKLAINKIKLEQQGAKSLQEEKNVVSVMVKDVEDTLTTAKINLKFNPDKVKIEDIKSPVLPDPGLKVFVGGKIDNDKGRVDVEALVVDEDLLIGTYTDIVDKTTLYTTQQVTTNRDTSGIQEENIAPIAQIIIEPKETKAAKGLTLDDILSYVEIDGIELRNAQGEEIPINVEDKPIKPTYASDLKDAYCYPNPTNKGWITFANLTKQVKVRIFNIAGELVYEEDQTDTGGKVTWKCINNAGEKVASGVYIYILKDPESGSMKKGKLGIIR